MRPIPTVLALVLTGLTLTTLPACGPDVEPETWCAIYEAQEKPQEGPQEPVYAPCSYCATATSETIKAIADWCTTPGADQPVGPLWCPNKVYTACDVELDDPSCEWQAIINGVQVYCCAAQ
jgi:hypothetical protein